MTCLISTPPDSLYSLPPPSSSQGHSPLEDDKAVLTKRGNVPLI